MATGVRITVALCGLVAVAGCGSPAPRPPGPAGPDADLCAPQFVISVAADSDLAAAQRAVEQEPAIYSTRALTRAEVYARFKKVFADQPDLLKNVRPEALPPAVWARPRSGDWAGFPALRQRLTNITHAQRVDLRPRDERQVEDCRQHQPGR